MLVSCSSDTIAGNASNSNVFYSSLRGPKAQLMLTGSHFCVTTPNAGSGMLITSWIKKYLDGDDRFTKFICGSTAPRGTISYKSSCG
jgi:hypothetical protein